MPPFAHFKDYLSRYWADEWTHIGVEYNFQIHQMFNSLSPGCVDSVERADFLKVMLSLKQVMDAVQFCIAERSVFTQEAPPCGAAPASASASAFASALASACGLHLDYTCILLYYTCCI